MPSWRELWREFWKAPFQVAFRTFWAAVGKALWVWVGGTVLAALTRLFAGPGLDLISMAALIAFGSLAVVAVIERVVVRRPVVVYEGFDEKLSWWKAIKEHRKYVHLIFHNESSVTARNARAKLFWWNVEYIGREPSFFDGKW